MGVAGGQFREVAESMQKSEVTRYPRPCEGTSPMPRVYFSIGRVGRRSAQLRHKMLTVHYMNLH